MKKALLAAVSALLLSSLSLEGGETGKSNVKFAWNAGMDVKFDNREYNHTDLDFSRTLFGARVDAAAGVLFESGPFRHRIMAGVMPLYEFGGKWTFQHQLYYQLTSPLGGSTFEILAGSFPRRLSRAYYSPAFFSSADLFYDQQYDGIQFSWRALDRYFELGVDWKGMISARQPSVREEFVVYSGGHKNFLLGAIRIGYSAYMHHYACSMQQSNVVDDILLSPYIETNIGYLLTMQGLTARLAYIQGFSRDRAVSDKLSAPGKGNFFAEIRHWNVGIYNDLYFGADLMPLYKELGPDGQPYGSRLYMGEPFMRNAGGKAFGTYDKVGLYYEPTLWKILRLRFDVSFHFNGGYAGCQQLIGINVNF